MQSESSEVSTRSEQGERVKLGTTRGNILEAKWKMQKGNHNSSEFEPTVTSIGVSDVQFSMIVKCQCTTTVMS